MLVTCDYTSLYMLTKASQLLQQMGSCCALSG